MADARRAASNDDILRGAIRRMISELEEKVDLTDIVEMLWSKHIIDGRQKQEIESYGTRKIEATGKLLTMVVDGEVEVAKFIEVLKNKIPWVWPLVDAGVKKVKVGEWSLHGDLDEEGML